MRAGVEVPASPDLQPPDPAAAWRSVLLYHEIDSGNASVAVERSGRVCIDTLCVNLLLTNQSQERARVLWLLVSLGAAFQHNLHRRRFLFGKSPVRSLCLAVQPRTAAKLSTMRRLGKYATKNGQWICWPVHRVRWSSKFTHQSIGKPSTEKRQLARAELFAGPALWAASCCFRAAAFPPPTIVTWLILPVVICLSQRLSHACLSINNFIL